jgi:hypothetical protein
MVRSPSRASGRRSHDGRALHRRHPSLTEWMFRSSVNWGTHELMSGAADAAQPAASQVSNAGGRPPVVRSASNPCSAKHKFATLSPKRFDPVICKQCQQPSAELSRLGLCPSCGLRNFEENLDGLTNRSGPRYEYHGERIRAGRSRSLKTKEAPGTGDV